MVTVDEVIDGLNGMDAWMQWLVLLLMLHDKVTMKHVMN